MKKNGVTGQQRFLSLIKLKEIEKWVKSVNEFNKKSIYKLTWGQFYKKLCQLGTKSFLQQYGFASKRKLQLFIARSNLWQEKITLADFEKSTEYQLLMRLRKFFFKKVRRLPHFNPKKHKLSTIHHYIYYYSLNFTALSLGFPSKQSFLNFIARALHRTESLENLTQTLSKTIQTLSEIDPVTLGNGLRNFHNKPLTQNSYFLRDNATLEELKRALKNETLTMVVASLGGGSAYVLDKKLQSFLDIRLRDLSQKSWRELEQNTPRLSCLWKAKLYQIFSGQALEQPPFILRVSRPLKRDVRFYCQFFSSNSTQTLKEDLQPDTNTTEIASERKCVPGFH